MRTLADAILAARPVVAVQRVYGIVTQASPLLVKIGASTVAVSVHHLASYTPTVSDYVAVDVQGADRLVIGKVV